MPQYETHDCRTYAIDGDGTRDEIANFTAEITRETRYVDGKEQTTELEIVGRCNDEDLPRITITADKFAPMTWVMPAWGSRCSISPGGNAKELLRHAIQRASKPERRTIYTHTGWDAAEGQPVFLHAGGAITRAGNDPSVAVRLPPELSRYDLTPRCPPIDAIRATLDLIALTKPEIMWPLIAATMSPIYGPVDFALHVAGRTGTFKSELMSLAQSHYGPAMDARHLPGSWSSTANALESQAYRVANCAFVLDDFVPFGTAWQVRAYQKNADQIIRSQGNQSGRARMTDTSSLQTTYYPRGIILSTGEDVPEGHSVRARMLILELTPGDISPAKLTAAQDARTKYATTVATIARDLIIHPRDLASAATKIRDQHRDIGHTRTPSMIGTLTATALDFIDLARRAKAIDGKRQAALTSAAAAAIIEAGRRQKPYLEQADPVDIFTESIRGVLAAQIAHVRTLNGGPPKSPHLFGWTTEERVGDLPTYKSHGRCIGWVDWPQDTLYLDDTAAYNEAKRVAQGGLSMQKQTLYKRIKDAGMLQRLDAVRQRNTVRITADGHPRVVIALALRATLKLETKDDER